MTGLEAIILAGGMGTRLSGVVSDVPKPMAQVGGRPFLAYLLDQLVRWNVREIILSIGYLGDTVRNFLGDGGDFGVRIKYAQEDSPRGTGGAIREAVKQVQGERCLILNGDSYFDLDFEAFCHFHLCKGASLSLALVWLADTGRYGRVEIDHSGRIISFQEKQENLEGYINSGIYLMDTRVIRALPESGKCSFEQEVLMAHEENNIYGMPSKGYFVDIGVPVDYDKICHEHENLLGSRWRINE